MPLHHHRFLWRDKTLLVTVYCGVYHSAGVGLLFSRSSRSAAFSDLSPPWVLSCSCNTLTMFSRPFQPLFPHFHHALRCTPHHNRRFASKLQICINSITIHRVAQQVHYARLPTRTAALLTHFTLKVAPDLLPDFPLFAAPSGLHLMVSRPFFDTCPFPCC